MRGCSVQIDAPAKLTRGLRVVGTLPGGFHAIEAEFVSLSLSDEVLVEFDVAESTVAAWGAEPELGMDWSHIPTNRDNLAIKALELVGRSAAIVLQKRIPAGGGLGGGSADAAAVLRAARFRGDPETLAVLGADVPFCLRGGRARVTGLGERLEPLAYEELTFTLVIPPFSISTAAVYAAYDRVGSGGGSNDLLAAAVEVEPALGEALEHFERRFGAAPTLAGSGSTFFVEAGLQSLGVTPLLTKPKIRVGKIALGGVEMTMVECYATPPSTKI